MNNSYKVLANSKLLFTTLDYDKFQLTENFWIILYSEKPTTVHGIETNYLEIHISKGAIFDGLSIPRPFRWFLPEIDYTNDLYSASGLVHDCLYASELLPKDIADDIFRSILRDSGISRFKAGIAHQAVKNFAKRHYGRKHDTNNLVKYIRIE